MSVHSGPRVGWVFEGGGAKGSFSFAAAMALIDAGVPFHCLAGTSVGALTALLLSCQARADGKKLWQEIRRQDVLPFRTWKILGAPYLFCLLFLHSYIWTYTGRRGWPDPGPMRRVLERAALFVMLIPVFSFGLSMVALGQSWLIRVIGGGVTAYFAFAIWAHTADDWPEEERRRLISIARSMPALELLLVPLMMVMALYQWLFGGRDPLQLLSFWTAFCALSLPLVIHLVAANAGKHAALSNVPLRQKVVDILAKQLPQIPTYVTVARESRHIDPDRPIISATQYDQTSPLEYFVTAQSEYVPMYLRIDGRPLEEVADWVTASAALPLGLVAPMSVKDYSVVDGGVADNVPVRPLVDLEQCDLLFVFRLNRELEPRDDDFTTQHPNMVEHWKRCWRKEDVAAFQPTPQFLEQDWGQFQAPKKPTAVPWRVARTPWPEIIIVQPDDDLGGLLDFSPEMRNQREAWGQQAAAKALDAWLQFQSMPFATATSVAASAQSDAKGNSADH